MQDVFYCPQTKPTGFDNMIVKARPLKKLCEFEGQQLPETYKSDCYNDVDETDFACKEKQRILVLNLKPLSITISTKMEQHFDFIPRLVLDKRSFSN